MSNPYDPTQSAYPPSEPYNNDGPYATPQQPFTGYPPQPDSAYPQPGYAPQQPYYPTDQPYYPPANPPGMYPPQQQQIGYIGYMVPQATETNGPAIASLVLGIVSLFISWIPFFGLAMPIVGLVMSSIGMKRLSGKGMAVAGLVLSIIALVVGGCISIITITSFFRY